MHRDYNGGLGMTDLILSLMTWIGTQTGYALPNHAPNIVITDRYNMCAQYGINNKGSCQASRLQGFYDKNVTIYLRPSFDMQNLNDRSQLLHELVHYVQWYNKQQQHECLGQLEVEAYELQDEWRVESGLKARNDPFKMIMLTASCEA